MHNSCACLLGWCACALSADNYLMRCRLVWRESLQGKLLVLLSSPAMDEGAICLASHTTTAAKLQSSFQFHHQAFCAMVGCPSLPHNFSVICLSTTFQSQECHHCSPSQHFLCTLLKDVCKSQPPDAAVNYMLRHSMCDWDLQVK